MAESRSMYGGIVLDTAVWSAIHEPRAGQLEIIEAPVRSGASLLHETYPTGHTEVVATLRRYLG